MTEFYYFKECAYAPLEISKPDLGLALAGGIIDIGRDLGGMFTQYNQSFKCWMVLQVHYQPVNPNDESHQGFDAYLSAAPSRIVKPFGIINGWDNPYKIDLAILTERIKLVNAKFIKDKSGLVLAGIKTLFLKMALYNFLKGRKWKPLPKFIENKRAVVNIKNKDNRCFGYAMLYFLKRANAANRHNERTAL